MKKLNKKGFTLTEMIVVIAIIGILAAVLIPSVVIYVQRAQKSNDEQLAASMTDEIERYCIENFIDEKNLLGSDIRTILVGKDFKLVPSNKSWTYIWNAEEKAVQVLKFKELNYGSAYEPRDPSEYAQNMFIIGKGKTDFEQVLNTLFNIDSAESISLLNIDSLDAKQKSLIETFTSNNTVYVKNDTIIQPAHNEQQRLNSSTIEHIVYCEMTFNIPGALAELVDQLPDFKVSELICSIDSKAKTALAEKIVNINSIRSNIPCIKLGTESFDVNTYTFTVGSYIENTVAQTFELDTLGIYTDSTTGERYYVRQVNASFYSLEGLSAKGSIAFLEICVKEDALIRDLTPVSVSELEALGIK